MESNDNEKIHQKQNKMRRNKLIYNNIIMNILVIKSEISKDGQQNSLGSIRTRIWMHETPHKEISILL